MHPGNHSVATPLTHGSYRLSVLVVLVVVVIPGFAIDVAVV